MRACVGVVVPLVRDRAWAAGPTATGLDERDEWSEEDRLGRLDVRERIGSP